MPISLETGAAKYIKLEYPFESFDGEELESYEEVRLPKYDAGADSRKILFVLDYMPTEDLISGRLLKGNQGKLLQNIINKVSEKIWLKETVRFSWLACTFNAFKTAGKAKTFQANAKVAFGKRIEFIIARYKPDVVVVFGGEPFRYFYREELDLTKNKTGPWLGVPRKKTIKGHDCTFYATFSLNTIAMGENSESALIGYMGKNLANAITNRHNWSVDAKALFKHKSVLIDTVAKFDKMLEIMARSPVVAVDTETANLNKIANKLLTIQFAKCQDYGYLIPLDHKDSPFLGKELLYIKKKLRQFFEGANTCKYLVYTNAGFDLNQTRVQLQVRYFANKLFCILAGEFCIDENHKSLQGVIGDYYYSLGNLAVQYGFTGYLTAEFGKQHRATIETADLDDKLLRYCSLDAVVPWAISQKQLELAAHIGHKKFESMVTEQLSDTIHTFSVMEINGNLIDVSYLFYLKTPQSPIEGVIKKITQNLLDTPAVRKANKIILKNKGVPTNGLFGEVNTNVFSLGKHDHKQILFYEVLALEPIAGKGDWKKKAVEAKKDEKKGGKLDKVFQKAYAAVPEVAMYTELSKAVKLRNAYVNSFIKLLGTSDDLKTDKHIRPSYKYLEVVTGRTSASDPNLQQVPTHSELGKHIKRLFIAPPGALYIKMDYRVHEVRGWGLISFDAELAKVFQAAKDLRDSYRYHPNPSLAKRLKLEADVHVINAAYFFTVAIELVDKKLRNNVKGVIFGLIYQMSIKTLAKTLDKTLEFTEKLVSNFNKRFPKGMRWIEDIKAFARKNYYVESPIGLRRHLWGYLLPDGLKHASKVYGDMDRRAVNSPIQGMCSQFMSIAGRALSTKIWNVLKEEKRDLGLVIRNSVHDALESTSIYENFLENLGHVEHAATTRVREIAKERVGFEFVVDIEIDFEVGASLANTVAWDFSIEALEEICLKALEFQAHELKYEVNVKETMRLIFEGGWDRAPKWMHRQARNIGWSYKGIKPIKARIEQKALEAKLKKEQEAKEALAKAEQAKLDEKKAVKSKKKETS